jgi:hypothetical protein
MQIRSTLTTRTYKPKTDTAAPKNEPQGVADWFRPLHDLTVGAKMLAAGQLYRSARSKMAKKNAKNPPLQNEANVKLEDPLVFVPGWTTTREAFDPLAAKLLEGDRNGGVLVFVSEGEFFLDRDCTIKGDRSQLQSGSPKVFEVVFSDVRLPPSLSSGELDTNLKAIQKLTRAEKIDVNAFSMGGLATRVYLDNGGNAIDQAMFLGTPHKGATFAGLANQALKRDIGWALSFAGIIPADGPALEWLTPEEDNGQLQGLNQRWPQQKAQVNEVHFAAGTGVTTADGGWWPFTSGDGLVAFEAAAPPGETAVPLPAQVHGHLNNSAGAYHEMQNFFGWKAD